MIGPGMPRQRRHRRRDARPRTSTDACVPFGPWMEFGKHRSLHVTPQRAVHDHRFIIRRNQAKQIQMSSPSVHTVFVFPRVPHWHGGLTKLTQRMPMILQGLASHVGRPVGAPCALPDLWERTEICVHPGRTSHVHTG